MIWETVCQNAACPVASYDLDWGQGRDLGSCAAKTLRFWVCVCKATNLPELSPGKTFPSLTNHTPSIKVVKLNPLN